MVRIILMQHGTGCCGVTHLYLGGTHDPFEITEACLKWSGKTPQLQSLSRYAYADNAPHSYTGEMSICRTPAAYSLDRPAETNRDRAVALVDDYKVYSRTSGIIEAVTTSHQKAWEPVLEGMGFVRGAQAVNSNSFKTITVWLLAYGQEPGTGLRDPKEV